jgi:hypothetical protein
MDLLFGAVFGQLLMLSVERSDSSIVDFYTQKIHRTTHLIWEECGHCPIFAIYALAFELQLRKKHGKTSVRVAEECQLAQSKENIQNRAHIIIRIHNITIKIC